MNLYGFDRHFKIVEKGPCDLDAALAVYKECYENGLKSYDTGEEAISSASFGLSRFDDDFIELSCHSHDYVTVHSDRIYYSSWLSKTFGLKRHFFMKCDKAKGKDIIKDYFSLDRHEFEAKYTDFLCR